MAEKKSAMSFSWKKTWAKVTALVRHCLAHQPTSRRLRSFRSDDRAVGLRNFLVDDRVVENCHVRKIERASTSSYGSFEVDVDARAQAFIDNFHRHLRLERQISLQLRYYRSNSSETESEERSPPCPEIRIG